MNPSCPDYRGLANMICEEIMAKDAALSEAQARIEALEWLVDVERFAPHVGAMYDKDAISTGGWNEWKCILHSACAAAGV